MSWFKVDDKFHGSKEVKLIPREHRAAAIGLWVLAGSWCSDHLNDGHVPSYMLDEFAATPELAEALVAATLWARRKDGYTFRNWAKWQQTRVDVMEKRAAVTERVRRHRQKKAEESGEGNDGVTRYALEETHPPSRPVPSRPDPTIDDDQSGGDLTSERRSSRLIPQGVSGSGDNMRPDLERIAVRVNELTARSIEPIEAGAIASHYLERAKTPPRMATRYVVTCLNGESPAVLSNFLDSGRWSE